MSTIVVESDTGAPLLLMSPICGTSTCVSRTTGAYTDNHKRRNRTANGCRYV